MIKRFTLLSFALAAASMVQAAEEHAVKADPEKGKAIASTVCAACHGADGNSPAPANPKLAGQIPEYLAKQIRNFQSQGGKPAERTNAVMNGMAMAVPPDMVNDVAAYFAAQKLTPDVAKNPKTVEKGQKLWRRGDLEKGIPACSGCHGPTGAGLPAQYPRLAGQWSDYIEAQLKSFRAGERENDLNKVMRTIALKMTDAEIKAVSDYAAGLR